MIFIIVICVVFIVLCLMFGLCACLRIVGEEDVWLMRQMEEKSIENADVFVYDGEPIGEVILVEEKDGGIEAVVKIKDGEHE